MVKYSVMAVVSGSKHIGVFEAASKKDAEDMAWQDDRANDVSMCHQCSKQCDDAQVLTLVVSEVKES